MAEEGEGGGRGGRWWKRGEVVENEMAEEVMEKEVVEKEVVKEKEES